MVGRQIWTMCLAAAFGAAPFLAYAAPPASEALAQQFVADYFKLNPLQATANGDHSHDTEIGDPSVAGHAAAVKLLHHYLDLAGKIDTAGLDQAQKDDLEFLIASINSMLLAEEKIQSWRINPDFYMGSATAAVYELIERDFAPAEDRLRSVIAREKLIPGMLKTGQSILVKPAAIFVKISLLQIDGNIEFFKTALPGAFTGVTDEKLKAAFHDSNEAVIAAIEDYKAFLNKIAPASTSPFAIGRDAYQQKLLYDEMVDLPVDRILAVGTEQLHRDQAAETEAAHAIDPKATLEAVIRKIAQDHVAANQLLGTGQSQLASLRQFVIDRKILTVIGTEQPKVVETPSFMRATTFAAMDPPGPLEKATKQAFYYITLPDPKWTAAKQDEYLQGYNTPLLENVSVHEVWPGHFVQYLYREHTPDLSLVRQIFSANTTVEGWAHYTEQMMIDEGLGNGDPKYRLTQLQDALLRDCRLIAGIKLHTAGMTVDQAKDLFVKECRQEPVVGEMEAYRGTEDPTYLVYTLGKLGILKLRDDYKAEMGTAYSLADFHDRFNRPGTIPLKLIRREIMGADAPLL